MSVLPCCRDATALFTEDAEGALEGLAKVKFAVHLSICTPCQRMRSQLRTTAEVLRALPPEAPKATDVDAIMALLATAPHDGD
jgi:anti-sigma factor ChrR (cupin superfamily)